MSVPVNDQMNIDEKDEIEEAMMQNMIEEFMNISDEDNKIFNLLKEEFKDLKILHYGSIMFIQNDLKIEHFPNISELLTIYEEIFSNLNISLTNTIIHALIISRIITIIYILSM